MAGVRAIYGLVLSIIILSAIRGRDYSEYNGFAHLSAGVSCGVAQFVSGITVGVIGEKFNPGNTFARNVIFFLCVDFNFLGGSSAVWFDMWHDNGSARTAQLELRNQTTVGSIASRHRFSRINQGALHW